MPNQLSHFMRRGKPTAAARRLMSGTAIEAPLDRFTSVDRHIATSPFRSASVLARIARLFAPSKVGSHTQQIMINVMPPDRRSDPQDQS
jgi:hypothetical protein